MTQQLHSRALIQITILNRYLYSHVCCSKGKVWKQTKYPLTNKQIKENAVYTPTKEYNSIIKGYRIGHDRAHTHTCIKKKEFCHLKQ